MIELSPLTKRHIAALFSASDRKTAEDILARDCAENLPLIGQPATPSSLERIRFATLRISGGDLDRLREAIDIAKIDWRDVLVAAGFGEDVLAHQRWVPRLDTEHLN